MEFETEILKEHTSGIYAKVMMKISDNVYYVYDEIAYESRLKEYWFSTEQEAEEQFNKMKS